MAGLTSILFFMHEGFDDVPYVPKTLAIVIAYLFTVTYSYALHI